MHGYCAEAGIDPAKDVIPVTPAAHYVMGGIWTDADGRTSMPGFWACGECASTGAHGANRLASNSLLEAVVFAARIADALGAEATDPAPADWAGGSIDDPDAVTENDHPAMVRLRSVMSAHLGVLRNGQGMRDALRAIIALEQNNKDDIRFANVLTTAKLIAISALNRTESRGGHFRTDHPEPGPSWARRTLLMLDQAEAVVEDLLA